MATMTRTHLAAYGALGLPLAMAALPLYVHLPKLYGGDLGMSLALLGGILLFTRLVDAVSDPVLGWLSDRWPRRDLFTAVGLPLLGVGMIALLHPGVVANQGPLAAWLAVWLFVTYLGFSTASIAYQAWGAQLSDDAHERTRITAAREIFTLIGVVAAAALPTLLGGESATGLARFGIVFAGLLAVCGAVTIATAPRPPQRGRGRAGLAASVATPLANREFRRLLLVFMLSGIAAAIPSTLVLFFVADVLQAAELAGLFLVVYFLSGALGIPLWVYASKRVGKEHAWLAGMVVAVVAFAWASRLGPGDEVAYGAICALSGLALGADLALPASILADVIDRDRRGPGACAEGGYFGIWNLVTKANLAIAAGLALPALDALGYAPGESGAVRSLALVYCLLPCVFKLGSAAVLWFMPVRGPLPFAKGIA